MAIGKPGNRVQNSPAGAFFKTGFTKKSIKGVRDELARIDEDIQKIKKEEKNLLQQVKKADKKSRIAAKAAKIGTNLLPLGILGSLFVSTPLVLGATGALLASTLSSYLFRVKFDGNVEKSGQKAKRLQKEIKTKTKAYDNAKALFDEYTKEKKQGEKLSREEIMNMNDRLKQGGSGDPIRQNNDFIDIDGVKIRINKRHSYIGGFFSSR